jgi:hypothetical protein
MPKRMAFLHPEAAFRLTMAQADLGNNLVFSDIWRSSLESLRRAFPEGKPPSTITKPPGFSGHNFGFSFDLDVNETMKRTKLSKKALDAALAKHGIWCHRRDGLIKVESWHYNVLLTDLSGFFAHSTAPAVERQIQLVYGEALTADPRQTQRCLQYLKLYNGDIDGKHGPLTKTAVTAFQRAWHLKPDGVAGPITNRVLQLRCAELRGPTGLLWSVK